MMPDLEFEFMAFRSAPPHGGRLILAAWAVKNKKFRSAPPHGGRLTLLPKPKP